MQTCVCKWPMLIIVRIWTRINVCAPVICVIVCKDICLNGSFNVSSPLHWSIIRFECCEAMDRWGGRGMARGSVDGWIQGPVHQEWYPRVGASQSWAKRSQGRTPFSFHLFSCASLSKSLSFSLFLIFASCTLPLYLLLSFSFFVIFWLVLTISLLSSCYLIICCYKMAHVKKNFHIVLSFSPVLPSHTFLHPIFFIFLLNFVRISAWPR